MGQNSFTVGGSGSGGQGSPGLSAYQIAVRYGFTGSEADWLASLVGAQGPEGPRGLQGEPGPAGPSGLTEDPGDLVAVFEDKLTQGE